MSDTLHPDVSLSVRLDAICSRHRYDRDPTAVLDELRREAGGRAAILAESAGTWAGYFDSDETRAVTSAIREQIPGAEHWFTVGAHRRSRPTHGT